MKNETPRTTTIGRERLRRDLTTLCHSLDTGEIDAVLVTFHDHAPALHALVPVVAGRLVVPADLLAPEVKP